MIGGGVWWSRDAGSNQRIRKGFHGQVAVYTETRRLRRASQVTSGRDVHLRPKEQPVLKELTGLGMWALVEGAGWRDEGEAGEASRFGAVVLGFYLSVRGHF